MLATRIVTAVVLIAAVLAALFALPPLGWAIVVLVVIAAAAHEWSRLTALRGARGALFVGITVLACLALLFGDFDRGFGPRTIVVVCGIATLFWLVFAPLWIARGAPPAAALARIGAGWIVLIAAWVAVVQLQARSPWLVLAAMAIVWIADTAAYFTGRAIGRRKLAPSVSPKKTWEGVWGGLAAVAVYALVVAWLAPHAVVASASPRATVALVACAVALAALSVVGDLTESLLKRDAGVKDSGTLLPGHGGVLDRIDALLAAMPASALLVTALSE